MKRIFLSIAGICALLNTFSQTEKKDTTGFKSRKYKFEELNWVTSYYRQDGNNAPVTGGIGTQKLTDVSNIFDIKLVKYDKKQRKHTFDVELGIDYYSSASSDRIDLKANSSASHQDLRIYPSVNWTLENDKKGTSFSKGLSFSHEYDYNSFGGNLSFSKKTNNKMGELTVKLQTYLDQVSIIKPIELRTSGAGQNSDYPTKSRNTYAGSIAYSQIINDHLHLTLIVDAIKQDGYLSLPFHRVYFNDSSVHQENLPNNRFKLPLSLRANYFLGDNIIIRTYYRFYTDDWGLNAHTINVEMPVKITPFVSISPFYRFYTQTAIKYFDAYLKHTINDEFYTSNYDLSEFNSHFFGLGVRLAPPKGVLGNKHIAMIEFRYGHYTKNINMNSDIISMNIKFK